MKLAALLLLTVIAQTALQPQPDSGAIAGTVIKAGTAIRQPLRNARLELTGGSGTFVMRTNVNGAFVFSNLTPGQYRLSVTCDGFIRQELPKKIVLARGQPAGNVLFELEPAPIAAGRVLDAYGEPISNVMIEALRRSYDIRGNSTMSRVATGLTDDRGEYRIFWLDPGDYFFYASSPVPDASEAEPPPPVAPTYFPGVNTPEEARTVRVDSGREVPVDFRLRTAALWGVSGHTMSGMDSRPVSAAITLVPPGQNPDSSRYHAQSSAAGRNPGEFSISNVAPGSYVLMAKTGSGDQDLTAFQRIVLRPLLAPQGYSLTASLNAPLSVRGQFYVESREPLDLHDARVALLSVDPDLPSPARVFARADGQFVLSGIVSGTYVMELSNLPQDLYFKAARFGDGALGQTVTISTQTAGSPLQVLLGAEGGRLQAAAYNAKGELQTPAHFVLVPDGERRERRDQYRLADSGDDGQASLRGIPPGSYKLLAWEELEPNAYLNPDYLRGYEDLGVPVKIASGDNKPVSVRVIPRGR